MVFEIKQDLTEEDLRAWNAAYMLGDPRTSGALRTADVLQRFAGGSFAVVGLCALVVFLLEEGPLWRIVFALAVILAGVLIFRPGSLRRRLEKRKDRVLADLPARPLLAVFQEDGCLSRIGGRERSWRYDAVARVWEDRERFYLLPPEGVPPLLILRKSAFVRGTPEDFRAFLRKKLEKSVEQIR